MITTPHRSSAGVRTTGYDQRLFLARASWTQFAGMRAPTRTPSNVPLLHDGQYAAWMPW
ncbi:hypothetical protein [Nocardiopsis xinjiangensis]|uniref:hypothetical protein n=1 Tax=Nocardiopsis xinjiangensis TaxID=124285 RepID=UPI00037A1CFE|nr:hypothetical protein [Nocardiopsis xinjiangensis]